MNVIDRDIGFQVSAVRNVAERLTCVFGFKLINQLRKFRICIDFITSLDDVLEILIVLCGQANAIIIVIRITIDIDGINDRSVFLRIALQIVLESPCDHGSQQTISRFRQYTGRERDFCRVYRDVLIRNQRINTVFRTTSCVPSVDGRLRILFGPVVLTEISRCIIFVVMFLHHQCLTIHWRSNNGRSIDDQLAITGYIIPGVVLITVCGCCVFSLGAFRIIAIIDNKTEIVVVPDILGSIQMQSDRRVFLRALLVCEPVRTPETARQPSAVVLHVFEALFEGIDGLGIQRITHNFTVINSVQNIVTTERRRICHIDPCIRIRWSRILDLIAVSTVTDTFPVIGFEYERCSVLRHNAYVRRLRHVHWAFFDADDTFSVLHNDIRVDCGINIPFDLVVSTQLDPVSGIRQHRQLHIDRRMRNRTVAIFTRMENRHSDNASHGAIFRHERGAGFADLDPVADRSAGFLIDNAIIPGRLVCIDGLVIDDTTASQDLIGRTFPILVVLDRRGLDFKKFQRNGFAIVPEMRRNLGNDRTILRYFVAVLIIHTRAHDCACASIDTRQVRDNVLVNVVHNAGEIVSRLQQILVIFVPDMNGISFVVDAVIEQLCIAQFAVYTSNTGRADQRITSIRLEDVHDTILTGRAQVPTIGVAGAVFTASTGRVLKQGAVTRNGNVIILRVPVTREVLDRFPGTEPKGFQVEVFHQFVAIIQRIPEAATILQGGEDLLGIHAVDTMHEMRGLLIVLVCSTDFTLLTLRDPHQCVDTQFHLFSGSIVDSVASRSSNRQVTDLVHNEVAGTGQVEVIRTLAILYNRFIQFAETGVGEIGSAAAVVYPDITKCDLTVAVCQRGRNGLSNTELIRPVRWSAMLDVRIDHRIFIGIAAIVLDMECTATIDGRLEERTMRTARRHNSGRNRQRIDDPAEIFFVFCAIVTTSNEGVGVVLAHQGVHVPVTARNFPAVNSIVASGSIVGVDIVFVIDVVGIPTSAAMRIKPCACIGVHRIVTDTESIAVADIVFQSVICLARQIRFRIVTCTPIDRVDTVGAFGVLQVLVRIYVEVVTRNSVQRDMCQTVIGITAVGGLGNILLNRQRIYCTVFFYCIAEQDLYGVLICRATSGRRNADSSTLVGVAFFIPVVITEIYSFPIPITVDFQLVSICKSKRAI